jgi:hypothetical protein
MLGPSPDLTVPAAMSVFVELQWLVAEQRALRDRERWLVAAMVADGVAWPVIAAALGVSRQAARQRFRRTHDRPAPGS